MKFKEETIDKILFENKPFYALYNVYERSLKLIDVSNGVDSTIREDIPLGEVYGLLEDITEEQCRRELQGGQERLFFMDGDTDG